MPRKTTDQKITELAKALEQLTATLDAERRNTARLTAVLEDQRAETARAQSEVHAMRHYADGLKDALRILEGS